MEMQDIALEARTRVLRRRRMKRRMRRGVGMNAMGRIMVRIVVRTESDRDRVW
jgi:hypothetical protein